MKRTFGYIVIMVSLRVNICMYAQNHSQKLSATNIIGTVWSVDYDNNNSSSTTVNSITNVFDGDLNSFFASYVRSGGWVGLDLDEKHVITKVAFCPRKDWPQRLLLGVFEGANQPDFGDALPLCMITEIPPENRMTEQLVHCSRGFRYVRYVGPDDVRCNIAELEFYGYPDQGDDSKLFQTTHLPDVVIHTTDAVDIENGNVYVKGMVSVISENGTKIYTDSLEIRGRGHASWTFPKKPYRIKLYNKTNLLGLPAKEKRWTLINNYGDKTLMRNLLAFDLSQRFEMPYTPSGVPVNVYLNGEFKGCYQLCDQIEVARNRVDIQEMIEKDVTMPNLSGGYLIEIDAYAYSDPSWFQSNRGVPVKNRHPKAKNIVPAQYEYIRSHFNLMETAIYSQYYTNPVTGFRRYVDTETFVKHFLIGEISGNTDTYWSVYMYKKRNDDKFYFGPAWDFDLAYDNDNRTYPINNNPNWIYASTGSSAHNTREMVNRMLTDTELATQLRLTYAHFRDNDIITAQKLLDVVDDYTNKLETSQKLNFIRWPVMNTAVHQNPTVHGSYAAEVENVKKYISGRIEWMDKKLGYLPGGAGTTSTSEVILENDQSVRAYANHIYIENIENATLVEIFNVAGLRLYSATIHGNTAISLPQGIYIVRLTHQDGNVKVVKCSLSYF